MAHSDLLFVFGLLLVATCKSCPSRYWGDACDKRCNEECSICEQISGTCLSCSYQYWGRNCSHRCGAYCGSSCDKETGKCSYCYDTRWGDYCTEECPANCHYERCDNSDGRCSRYWRYDGVKTYCKSGFWGSHCNNSCSDNDCLHCHMNNGTCFACKGGYQLQNSTCVFAAPSPCVDSTCSVCHGGFWGPTCQNACEASGCAYCDHSTGACLHCKTGLWGSECQHNCSAYCQYMNCDISTGRCRSCTSSRYWGPECEHYCPEGCKYYCYRETGVCSRCLSGFWGTNCTVRCGNCYYSCSRDTGVCRTCKSGSWGDRCDKICNFNCGTCDKNTGECITCGPRSWGSQCQNNCSDNCQDRKCSNSTGRCLSCVNFNWGENCEYKCPSGCLNDCDRDTGVCPKCVSHTRWGTYCNLTCEETCRHCAQDGTCLSALAKAEGSTGADQSNAVVISLGVVSLLTVVIGIGAFFVFVKKRRYGESLTCQMQDGNFNTRDVGTAAGGLGPPSNAYIVMKEEAAIDSPVYENPQY